MRDAFGATEEPPVPQRHQLIVGEGEIDTQCTLVLNGCPSMAYRDRHTKSLPCAKRARLNNRGTIQRNASAHQARHHGNNSCGPCTARSGKGWYNRVARQISYRWRPPSVNAPVRCGSIFALVAIFACRALCLSVTPIFSLDKMRRGRNFLSTRRRYFLLLTFLARFAALLDHSKPAAVESKSWTRRSGNFRNSLKNDVFLSPAIKFTPSLRALGASLNLSK